MNKPDEISLEDFSLHAYLAEAKSLVDREIHSIPFFLLFGVFIGLLGWMAELQQSQKIAALHDILISQHMLSDPIWLLYLALLAYVFFIAVIGRSAAKYGYATIHSFWSAWVSITAAFLGWLVVAYAAPWKVSEIEGVLALKVGMLLIIYALVILIVLAHVMTFYELRVSRLTMRQMFSIKNLWQVSLFLGVVFLCILLIEVIKLLFG